MGLEEFVAAWNARDAQAVAAEFTPGGVRHQFALPEVRLEGREAIVQGVAAIVHAAPDCALQVRSHTAGHDGRVTVEWTFTGSLQNDLPGLPANGAAFVLPGVSVYTFAPDGGITQENVYWDSGTLLAAAGLLG